MDALDKFVSATQSTLGGTGELPAEKDGGGGDLGQTVPESYRVRQRRASILTFHPRKPPPRAFPPTMPPHNALCGLGTQVNSMRATAPVINIGREVRGRYEKLYLSAEHAMRLPSNYTKDVSYEPKYVGEKNENTNYAYGTMLGRHQDTKLTFFPAEKCYERGDMLGKQVLSGKTTEPNYSIGTSTREKCAKLYVSQAHTKGQTGENTPGPVTSKPISSFGRQANSTRANEARATIGNGYRWTREKKLQVPGPGTYF